MVSLHAKFGDKGFRIVSVSDEDASPVDKMVTEKSMNYFTAVTPKSYFQTYGIRAYPTMMLVDADGKLINTKTGVPDEASIEKWIEALLPKKVDVEVSKKAKKAAGAYDDGDFSKAYSEAKKIKDTEGATAEDLQGVDRILELVGKQVEKAKSGIEKMITDKEYLKLSEYIDANEKTFKDTDASEAFKTAEEKLKDKEVKDDLKAQKSLAKIEEDYKKAGDNVRKQMAAIKSAESIVKKNEGTKAAEKAAELVSKWNAALPAEK